MNIGLYSSLTCLPVTWIDAFAWFWLQQPASLLMPFTRLRLVLLILKSWASVALADSWISFLRLVSISDGEGNGNPFQYSCLANPMDRGAWQAAVHGVTRSQTQLSDFTFTFHFHALEKEMATHSSVLALRIQGMEEPGGLPSMGSHRVGHD